MWRVKDLLYKISAYNVDLRDTHGISKATSHFRPDINHFKSLCINKNTAIV